MREIEMKTSAFVYEYCTYLFKEFRMCISDAKCGPMVYFHLLFACKFQSAVLRSLSQNNLKPFLSQLL